MFGPTLLRTNDSPATLDSVVDTKEQVRVVELMTKFAWEVFGTEASVMPRDQERHARHRLKRENSPRVEEIPADRGELISYLHFCARHTELEFVISLCGLGKE